MIKLRTFVLVGLVSLTAGTISAQVEGTTSKEDRRAAITESKNEIADMVQAMELDGKKAMLVTDIMNDYNQKLSLVESKGLAEKDMERAVAKLDEEKEAKFEDILDANDLKKLAMWESSKAEEAESKTSDAKPVRPKTKTDKDAKVAVPQEK